MPVLDPQYAKRRPYTVPVVTCHFFLRSQSIRRANCCVAAATGNVGATGAVSSVLLVCESLHTAGLYIYPMNNEVKE